MPRTFMCQVPVTVILTANIPGSVLPLTRSGLKALAHAMVCDAMQFTEEHRGFYAGGVDNTSGNISAAWLLPEGCDSLTELTRRVAKGRKPCTTTTQAGSCTATG